MVLLGTARGAVREPSASLTLHHPEVVVAQCVALKRRECEDRVGLEAATEGSMSAEEVVRAELHAWSTLDVDQIMAYFTQDATWKPSLVHPTSSGFEEIRRAVEGILKDMTWGDIEILHLAVVGNVVLTELVHRFIMNGKRLDAPGMGTFEVAGDKITAWRNYFCPGAHE